MHRNLLFSLDGEHQEAQKSFEQDKQRSGDNISQGLEWLRKGMIVRLIQVFSQYSSTVTEHNEPEELMDSSIMWWNPLYLWVGTVSNCNTRKSACSGHWQERFADTKSRLLILSMRLLTRTMCVFEECRAAKELISRAYRNALNGKGISSNVDKYRAVHSSWFQKFVTESPGAVKDCYVKGVDFASEVVLPWVSVLQLLV